MELTQKEERLYEIMKGYAKKDICIAFSGGADSSLLLKLAVKCAAPGVRVHAVTFETGLLRIFSILHQRMHRNRTDFLYEKQQSLHLLHFVRLLR